LILGSSYIVVVFLPPVTVPDRLIVNSHCKFLITDPSYLIFIISSSSYARHRREIPYPIAENPFPPSPTNALPSSVLPFLTKGVSRIESVVSVLDRPSHPSYRPSSPPRPPFPRARRVLSLPIAHPLYPSRACEPFVKDGACIPVALYDRPFLFPILCVWCLKPFLSSPTPLLVFRQRPVSHAFPFRVFLDPVSF